MSVRTGSVRVTRARDGGRADVAAPRVLHVVESWRPVPSGYAERSWWIVDGQARAGIAAPAVLVSSRQSVYGHDTAEAPADVALRTLAPTPSERALRAGLPVPLARPFHVDARSLERGIVAAARRHAAALVHVHWSSAIGAAAARAARTLDVPLVAEVRFDLAAAMGAQTFRGRAAPLERLVRRRFERHLGDAAVIVAASDALAGLLRESFPTLSDRVHVVPNGVDAALVARCDAARREARGSGSGVAPGSRPGAVPDDAPAATPTRVTVGTTSKMLRYENLDALVRLAAARPALDLLFVGDGPERAALERLAAPLNATRRDRVRFAGRVPFADIPAWLARIDLFAVPRVDLAITRFASPLKVVEAMACARAVVATSVGGSTALLANGCGELVPPGNDGAFGAALDRLLTDAVRRKTLGHAARERVLRDYDGARLLARYADIYARALG